MAIFTYKFNPFLKLSIETMIKLYGIPNCDTIKKARKWLKDHNIDYKFHDYKKLGEYRTD